jgi:hypothetical protein
MRRVLVITGLAMAVLVWGAGAATRWVIQPPARTGHGGVLHGISCLSSADCTAVGAFDEGVRALPLTEHWDGSTWTAQAAPAPAGAVSTQLLSISCVSATDCTAAGYTGREVSAAGPLAEHWDGSAWAIQATPTPAGAVTSRLTGVSCASATTCTAVGWFSRSTASANTTRPLAERWDGTRWRIQATPIPAGSVAAVLSGVSCISAGNCTAAGSSDLSPHEPDSLTLAEHWDGSAWTVQTTANPSGSLENGLNGISCVSAANCTAVGSAQPGNSPGQLLAEHWDGTTWALQATPAPPGATTSELAGVSCVPAGCTAVGTFQTSSPDIQLLAEFWNGSAWVRQAVPLPGNSDVPELDAVSCAQPAACTAVGLYFRSGDRALIEAS